MGVWTQGKKGAKVQESWCETKAKQVEEGKI